MTLMPPEWEQDVKESTGCSRSLKTAGPPDSPTMFYTARASVKKAAQLDTDIGKCWQCFPVNSHSEESSLDLAENVFTESFQDPKRRVNTFGRKILECLVEDMEKSKYMW